MKCIVTYTSVDGVRQKRPYWSLKGAQVFAHRMVGPTPTLGSYYAISDDGVGKITVSGDWTLKDIFPEAI